MTDLFTKKAKMNLKFYPQGFFGSATGIASLLLLMPACKTDKENQHPNIILFLADDLGYGDLQCYSGDGIKTPAIEAIVNQGVRFTSCYSNGPESSPTRTALLTGRYQQRAVSYTHLRAHETRHDLV